MLTLPCTYAYTFTKANLQNMEEHKDDTVHKKVQKAANKTVNTYFSISIFTTHQHKNHQQTLTPHNLSFAAQADTYTIITYTHVQLVTTCVASAPDVENPKRLHLSNTPHTSNVQRPRHALHLQVLQLFKASQK